MSSISDQIRELQKRLEQINEAPVAAFNQNAGTVPDAAAAEPQGEVSAGSVATAPEVAEPTTISQDPNQIPTIEAATFSQAYAQARKQGLKKFKWCGVYAVKDEVKPQPVPPTPPNANDPMTFAKAYSLRNTPNQPLLKKTDVTRAGPNATNLKPGGGIDFSKQLDVKAVR